MMQAEGSHQSRCKAKESSPTEVHDDDTYQGARTKLSDEAMGCEGPRACQDKLKGEAQKVKLWVKVLAIVAAP